MTEETQQPASEPAAGGQQPEQNLPNASTETAKAKDKKEKCRPMTKVVVRRLPATMTQEQFLEQVSPLPEYDYFYFAKADMSLGQYAFSRAYIDFVDQQDIFEFREKFDSYVFVDAKGMEYPAVVEFAPFQRVPKKRIGKKKDLKCGTIESDPYYISFLESLKNQETDVTNNQPKTEYSFQPSDHAPKKVTTTPLLDFLKQRKQEKQRLRDEKREEKRRRDLERKRNKDEPIVSKVLKNIDDRERDKDREISKENKENKDDKERLLQKDIKNRNKKDEKYRDKMSKDRDAKPPAKNYRDRDDRIKERDIKQHKKPEEKKFYNKIEDRDSFVKDDRSHEKEDISYKERKLEEKRGKSYEKMRQEKKRLTEIQKKQNVEMPSEEPDEDYYNVDDNRDENDEDNYTKNLKEKNDENRPKYKIKKNMDNLKNSHKTDIIEQSSETSRLTKTKSSEETDTKSKSSLNSDIREISERFVQSCSIEKGKANDAQFNVIKDGEKKSPTKSRITKRRSSLESGGDSGTGTKTGGNNEAPDGSGTTNRDNDGSCLRRHKSLDGGNDNNFQKNETEDKDKDKKDPRLERRIRNKDRPAMEIYRPGMGKFSKQRMEREKSTTEERATPSQSPTPTSSNPNTYKCQKSSGSEVRSMTFKRSISRDVS